MTIGVKYIGHGSPSGYGVAAFAYIRALHNAGIPVWSFFLGPEPVPGQPEAEPYILRLASTADGDPSLADLHALISATAQSIAYDTVVVHSIPEQWRVFAEAGKRLIGYTVWEADAIPGHWQQLLDTADAILVPSRFSAELFVRAGASRLATTESHCAYALVSPSTILSSTPSRPGIRAKPWAS